MRSLSRRALVAIAVAALLHAAAAQGQPAAENPQGQVNRPRSLGPVRLARMSGEDVAPVQGSTTVSRSGAPVPLALPGKSKTAGVNRPAAPSSSRAITTVLGSLGVVLGLFFLAVWVTRRVRPTGQQALPKEAVEVLGRLPLAGRQQMHLVRVGGKLLLLSVTPTGAETLTEITDPQEVERLCGLCQMSQPGSITETFRQVLSQFEREPAPGGFVGEASTETAEPAVSPRSERRVARSAR